MVEVRVEDIDTDQVTMSVEAVLTLLRQKANASRKKKILLDDEAEPIFLVFSVKQMLPIEEGKWKLLNVTLPHVSVKDVPSVCIFVKDLQKGNRVDDEPVIHHYKTHFRNQQIKRPIEVIPLHMLRTHYKPYETKRRLAGTYDQFFTDERIAAYLPKLLGKEFLKKKGVPMKLKLNSPSLKEQLAKVMQSTSIRLSCASSSYQLPVGDSRLPPEKLEENFRSLCKALETRLPGGWENVRSISLKGRRTLAVPVYVSTSLTDIKFEPKKESPEPIEDELSTIIGKRIVVYPDGNVKLKSERKLRSGKKLTNDGADSTEEVHKKPKRKLATYNLAENVLRKIESAHRMKRQKMSMDESSNKKSAARPRGVIAKTQKGKKLPKKKAFSKSKK